MNLSFAEILLEPNPFFLFKFSLDTVLNSYTDDTWLLEYVLPTKEATPSVVVDLPEGRWRREASALLTSGPKVTLQSVFLSSVAVPIFLAWEALFLDGNPAAATSALARCQNGPWREACLAYIARRVPRPTAG